MILNGLSQRVDMEIYSHLDVWGCTDRNAISINGNYARESLCSMRICPFVCKSSDCLILTLETAAAFLPLMGGTWVARSSTLSTAFPKLAIQALWNSSSSEELKTQWKAASTCGASQEFVQHSPFSVTCCGGYNTGSAFSHIKLILVWSDNYQYNIEYSDPSSKSCFAPVQMSRG